MTLGAIRKGPARLSVFPQAKESWTSRPRHSHKWRRMLHDGCMATPSGPLATPAHRAVRPGRAPATTHAEISHAALALFIERGFDATTIDDIARAAGIGRRTFFRYFASKNELPWGDFDELLDTMRAELAAMDATVPLLSALRDASLSFNTFPESARSDHRRRMWLILNVPSLTAYSTLKYAAWRAIVAEYVAQRRGEEVSDLAPQAISWACLGLCLSAYERWLADEDADLLALIEAAFLTAESVFTRQLS